MSAKRSKKEEFIVKSCLIKINTTFSTISEAESYLQALRHSFELANNVSSIKSPAEICKICSIANPQILLDFGICLDRDNARDFAHVCGYSISKGKLKKKINSDDYFDKFGRSISTGNKGKIVVTFAEAHKLLNHEFNLPDLDPLIKSVFDGND